MILLSSMVRLQRDKLDFVYLRSDHITGDGVTERRRDRLREAIGSTRNPTLFGAIQALLRYKILQLATDMADILDGEVSDILAQIGSNIKLLRGTEAQVSAKNCDFLERLDRVVIGVLKEMESIGEIAEQVKREAEKDGYY
jgi:hypothetical protein